MILLANSIKALSFSTCLIQAICLLTSMCPYLVSYLSLAAEFFFMKDKIAPVFSIAKPPNVSISYGL